MYYSTERFSLLTTVSSIFEYAHRFARILFTYVRSFFIKITENVTYEECLFCNKPLINEENLKILRRKWAAMGIGISAATGAVAASALPLLGFGSAGVTAGSLAASSQGAAVTGSVFAICQSLGATGLGTLLFGATGTVAGGVGALGLIYKFREKFDWCRCKEYDDIFGF